MASKHYVNNPRFLEVIVKHKAAVDEANKVGSPCPQIPNYIGECILKIANNLSFKPNFIGYSFRDEMISDGIENCLMYFNNFDPQKSSNPFAYFTQIIYFAFIRRIQKEKKQKTIKDKMIADTEFSHFVVQRGDDSMYAQPTVNYGQNNTETNQKRTKRGAKHE